MAAVGYQMSAPEAKLPLFHVPFPVVSDSVCWFPASPLQFEATDTETDTRDTHYKHLEPFPCTGAIYEPDYP